jgi:hypothetical protein
MLAFASGMIFSATAMPGFARTVPKSELLILAPYEVAFVQSASCPAGKVLKVTGAIRGLDRRKVCVSRGRLCNGCQATKPKLTDCAWRCEAMVLECVGGEKNIPAARHLLSRSLPPRSPSSQRRTPPYLIYFTHLSSSSP